MLSLPIGSQYFFNGPALVEAGVECFSWHAQLVSPLRYREILAVESQASIAASITRLFCRRGPSAIARLVIAIGVDAIKRVRHARAWPHIIIESLKGFAPPRTDLDTSPAVFFIAATGGVGTALNHVRPYSVFRRVNLAMMLFGLRPVANTSTARGMAPCKAISNYGGRPPAIAPAKPKGVPPRCLASVANDSQPAETLPGYVLYTFVGNGYNLFSHVRTSSTNVMRGLRGVRCAQQSPLFYHMPERAATI